MNQPVPTGLKILVVDDEPSVRESFQMLLTHLGHVVTTAGAGITALELAARHPYDLVMTDYYMPDMRGDELARHLKQRYPGLPILMVTAYAEVVQADGLYGGLVKAVLNKPFDIPQLNAAMVKALGPELPPVPAAWHPALKPSGNMLN